MGHNPFHHGEGHKERFEKMNGDKIEACTEECASKNDCAIGGVECASCGSRCCATELDGDGNCPNCASADEEED